MEEDDVSAHVLERITCEMHCGIANCVDSGQGLVGGASTHSGTLELEQHLGCGRFAGTQEHNDTPREKIVPRDV